MMVWAWCGWLASAVVWHLYYICINIYIYIYVHTHLYTGNQAFCVWDVVVFFVLFMSSCWIKLKAPLLSWHHNGFVVWWVHGIPKWWSVFPIFSTMVVAYPIFITHVRASEFRLGLFKWSKHTIIIVVNTAMVITMISVVRDYEFFCSSSSSYYYSYSCILSS